MEDETTSIKKLDADRPISGIDPADGIEFVYYEDDGRTTPRKLFKMLLSDLVVRRAENGGRVSDACSIRSPDGKLFRAMYYHGDLDGWREDIEAGVASLGLLLAKIVDDRFVVSDGRSYLLEDCDVSFSR